MTQPRKSPAYLLAFIGVMAAAAFVSNYLMIPVGTSRVHLGNSIALLAGMLFGGPLGALAAGLGSALFDVVYGFADPVAGGAIPPIVEAVVTFINKGLMALACGVIVNDLANEKRRTFAAYLGAAAGALLYVALFLIKTNLYALAFTPDTLRVVVPARAASSLINAGLAVLIAPVLYNLLRPALRAAGLYERISPALLHWPQ
ncbi:MAG: ECF transporter S component [Clostridiales bacterium]|nr:ECF transporter S component [Clostridiales bacterium]